MARHVLVWLAVGAIFSGLAWGQTLDLSGPDQMGRCEQAAFTITLTNDTPQTLSQIVITETRPNSDFVYVSGSAEITLHDGSVVSPAEPAEPGLDLVWDIDSILGYAYELPPGGTLTVQFDLATNCNTVSGTHQAQATGTGLATSPSDSLSVEILPGAVRIYKSPSVVDAHVGDTVIWTITVENTGLGPIHNVVVTDTLGSGLSYKSSSPAGTPSGQTVVWDSSTVPALAEIPAGSTVQLEIQAQVIACEGLDNSADVKFGCDDSVCFDTAVDGGTATASIHLIVDNPLLEFTPPTIQIPYCDPDGTTVTMTVTNNGAGPAKNVRLEVNFPADLSIQNVVLPATWDGTYFHLPDLDAGASFDLQFDVVYTGDWCAGGPSGSLYWQAIYDNVCGDEFRPPAVFSTYGTSYDTAGPPSLSVSLTGDDQVYICTEHNYNLSVAFSGLDSCGGGTTSGITVTVNVPQGFTVTDPGSGTWTPGGDGTGGTITWTGVDPATGLSTSIGLRAPGTGQCGEVATLTATATAVDCCGCTLSASDSVSIAIECYQLITATREASPATQEKCGTITYTNTYQFADDPALDAISFDELVFTESAANDQGYVEGSLQITIDGTPANPITVVDNTTTGGTFVIQGIDDTGSVRNHTLVISYDMAFTASSQPTACPSSHSFYDWATLDLGQDCATGDECNQPCQATEVLLVTAATPSMSVSVTGLPDDFVDPCGTYDVTVTLTKTSDYDPTNVKLQLENLNYYIVDLSSISCSGDVTPTNCTSPTNGGTYYEWDYGNAFVGQPNGAQSVLQFQVRKRCNPGVNLTATALFEDSCGYSSCSVSDSDSPSYMREPLLYIYKTPEVIYATENTVTWTIYVTNGGAGPAYEVWVDDILGSGLVYDSSVVDPDITVVPGEDHTGAPINGVSFWIPQIAAGGTREIQITARMVACQELTDQVRAGQSCGDVECVTPIEDSSYVLIPDTVLVATSDLESPMATCSPTTADISIRNAGDPTAYHLVARMVLPPGVEYIPGTTEWQVDGGAWNSGGDPTITGDISTGYTLEWDENQVSGLASLSSRSTIVVQFGLRPVCNFDGGYFEAYVDYETVCQGPGTVDVGLFYVEAAKPDIRVTKRQVSPSGSLDCGGEITWEITVENVGDAAADYVWVEDTLGDGFDYVSSAGDGVYAVDDGDGAGQVVTWALEDLPPGTSAILTLTAQDNGTCGTLTNEVQARWGCGDDLDSSSITNDAECLTDIPATDSTTASRNPSVSLATSLEPTEIPACGQATFTLTIQNTSTATAAAVDVANTLPTGLSYVPGTTEIDCGAGFAPAPDPAVFGGTLVWYDELDTGNNLCDSIPPGGTIQLKFTAQASCYLTAGSMDTTVYFYDCCYETQFTGSTSPTVQPALPVLTITKEPESVALDCHEPSDTVTWTITVENTGSAQADWVRVEDTLGDSLVYISSNPAATNIGGNTYAWEFGPLAPGGAYTLEITAYLSRPPDDCSAVLRTDTARATWGCGTPDGDPTTPEGCASDIWVEDSAIVTIPDLTLSPSDITPILTCSADGDYSGEVRIRVRNNGDAPVNEDFQITVEEANTGWTTTGSFSSFGGTLPINPGSSRTIHIPGWPVSCTYCDYQFTVTVDSADDICECNEANNVEYRSYTITLPDLRVDTSAISISCAGDGAIGVSGSITVANDGCGDDFTGDIPVRFTLYGAAGCSGDVVDQWTETLTGVSIPAGGTQAFQITHTVSTNICSASGCTASLYVELDPDDVICECYGTNNTYCADLPVDIPDVTVRSQGLSLTCAGDGQVRISGTVTLGNEGCGSVTADIPMRFVLQDGSGCTGTVLYGWTETFTGVNIPPDGEQTFTIDHTFPIDLCAEATGCAVSLLIEADYTDSICECDGGNNTLCADFPIGIPDLAVTAVTPDVPNSCAPGSVAVTVTNVGCVESPAGVAVKITGDATGEATLPAIPAGGEATVTVGLNEALPCGDHTITATVDPDGAVCECSSGNNSRDAQFTVIDPDLTIANLSVTCLGDGSFSVTATVVNQGTEGSPATQVRIYVDGPLFATLDVPALGVGESHPLEYTSPRLKCGIDHTFRLVVDEEDAICECDEANNESEAVASCGCPALVTDKEILQVARGGVPIDPSLPIQPGDVITYRLSVTNVGAGAAFDVDISDELPAEFLYVSGSTNATWPSGSYTADPAGAPGPSLAWDTSAELWPDETLTLEFQAVVTSAVVQGQVYTNSMCATGTEGDGTPIPPDMSATYPDDTDPDDCSSVSHVAAAVPALSVNKEIVDVLRGGVSIWPTDAVEPGDLIHYRFTIRNVGEGIAYDVDFTDELPPGLEYDTAYADGTYQVDSPTASGSLGLPDGATGTLYADISAQIDGGGTLVADFYAYVTSDVQQGVDLANYAAATGEDGYGTPIPPGNPQIGDASDDDPDDPDPDDTGLAVIGVHEPALALEKEIVDVLRGGVSIWPTETVLPEDVIVYRVVARNVGLGTAYDVDFSDRLPEGLEYDTAYGEGTYQVDSPPHGGTLGVPDGATGEIYADISVQLDPGATLTIEYRVRVRPDARPGAVLENLAEVTGDDGAGTDVPIYNPDIPDDYPDSDSTGIRVGIPALTTGKELYLEPCACEPPGLLPGTEVEFVLRVKNVGYSTAYDIVVRDLLPAGLAHVPGTSRLILGEETIPMEPDTSPDGRLLVWYTGLSLEPGEELSLIFSVRIGESVEIGTILENVMSAEGVDDLSRPVPADASAYVPEDTDPDDSSALRFKVGDPDWGPPPCLCPCPKGGE